ncbi:hypothetical protein KTR66_05480 [Roseococcus sp. SDR]|uniref:hypothetical protein n=1 Tax=Roseococcus sp. SDR TaxID=2835532 RepID=UPI001BCB1221|nr:hypothetical protein [Roseococcus sp. SDR]MBS7789434.1 hypothetical protein [Roseococcus sp. SDR]MBV1844748.1 hypothetical protein [Roseococcus sp. SDR]
MDGRVALSPVALNRQRARGLDAFGVARIDCGHLDAMQGVFMNDNAADMQHRQATQHHQESAARQARRPEPPHSRVTGGTKT